MSSDIDDDEKQHHHCSDVTKINRLGEIIQEFRNFLTSAKFCVECATMRTEVSSLISELELYQSSVPLSLTVTKSTTKSTSSQTVSTSNKTRKHLKTLAKELGNKLFFFFFTY